MNLAGYDAATPGNHDFDWGLPFLRRAVTDARFPYVSANICAASGDTLLYPPYRVVQRQQVRIAITGFTTPGTMVWDRDQLGRPRPRGADRAGLAPVFAAMRRDADVVVALVHSGLGGRASYDTAGVGGENAAAALAGLPARPDLVVVGHSHREIRDSVLERRPLRPAAPYGASVSVVHLDLAREDGRWRVRRIRADLVSTARGRAVAAAGAAAGPGTGRGARRGPARAIGLALGADAGRRGAGRAGRRSSASSRTCSAGAPARSSAAASAFDLRAGFDADTIRVAHVLALYPVRQHPARRAHQRRAAQGVPRVERALLPGRSRRADRAQRLGAGLQLRHGGRRHVRDRPAAAGRRADPGLAVRGQAGAADRQLHHGRQQLPADRRPAATTCCAARRWSTTRASGFPTC